MLVELQGMVLGSSSTDQLTSGLKVITECNYQRKALCESGYDSMANCMIQSFSCSEVCYDKVKLP